MPAKVFSCAIVGLDGAIVEVEADISPGLPKFTVVGLPDTAVQESRERVRPAIRNSGFTFPMKRITVNLAPADLQKSGPAYDLPIAIGILLTSEQLFADVSRTILLGELSLDGGLRHTNGILPMVALAREQGFSTVIVPEADAKEAALVDGVSVIPVASLAQLVSHLRGDITIPEYEPSFLDEYVPPAAGGTDLALIKGQEHVKRALEVAAAGGHNIVMIGPPGSGKTLLSRALPSILPPMTNEEALEVTKIYSISGLLPADIPLMRQRPFRAPHYTISNAGLVGGGHFPKPGEISLSHRGVLFLDELPEFGQSLLETLRQPLEDKVVTISRAQGSITFPANFMLVGAMNPCPCGFFGSDVRICRYPSAVVERYRGRLSGPLRDRFDMALEIPALPWRDMRSGNAPEGSAAVRQRVVACRRRQLDRQGCPNGRLAGRALERVCGFDEAGAERLFEQGASQFRLSARGLTRVLRVARTLADLDGRRSLARQDVAEALQFRLPESGG